MSRRSARRHGIDPLSPWGRLVGSIRAYRAPGARFFKPVCVISAIDLADEGALDPNELNADAIIQRFRRYVGVIFPERAELGWKPLWHLSNDGLWDFFEEGERLQSRDFGSRQSPNAKADLFDRFDHLTIAEELLDAWTSENDRAALRLQMVEMLEADDDTCRPFARQLADPLLALTPDAWPPERERRSREQLDLFGLPTGVEDEGDPTQAGVIKEPFDPESIDVSTRNISIDLLLSRAQRGMLELQPDFQRRWGIWDAPRQSRLIESLLLRIPLPVIYAAETRDERWEIVDGIQRLSTIARFIEPEIVGSAPLTLTGLEYLRDYEGISFEQLSDRLRLRLLETELQVHLIRRGTPEKVKFNVFKRVNTGGVTLSAQEIRHAITPGPARYVLEELAEDAEFLKATDYAVKSTRMDDRELVLRFLAFHLLGPTNYRVADLDTFLLDAMAFLNEASSSELEDARRSFSRAMSAAHQLFGSDAFRKIRQPREKRKPINKALFEAVSVNLAELGERQLDLLASRKKDFRRAFADLCRDRTFDDAISQGTSDVKKVRRRFEEIRKIIRKVMDE